MMKNIFSAIARKPGELLRHVRQSPDSEKRRWAIIGTVAIALMFSLVWVRYFDSLVRIPEPQTSETESTEVTDTADKSLWQTMKDGVSEIKRRVDGQFREQFGSSRDVIVDPDGQTGNTQ